MGPYWVHSNEDEAHLARFVYLCRTVHRDRRCPAPNNATDGSCINYPEVGLAGPRWNTTGNPRLTFYFKEGYTGYSGPNLGGIRIRSSAMPVHQRVGS